MQLLATQDTQHSTAQPHTAASVPSGFIFLPVGFAQRNGRQYNNLQT